MTERHYHLIHHEEEGLTTLVRLDGVREKNDVCPSRLETEAARAFVQVLLDAGDLRHIATKPGEPAFIESRGTDQGHPA